MKLHLKASLMRLRSNGFWELQIPRNAYAYLLMLLGISGPVFSPELNIANSSQRILRMNGIIILSDLPLEHFEVLLCNGLCLRKNATQFFLL